MGGVGRGACVGVEGRDGDDAVIEGGEAGEVDGVAAAGGRGEEFEGGEAAEVGAGEEEDAGIFY